MNAKAEGLHLDGLATYAAGINPSAMILNHQVDNVGRSEKIVNYEVEYRCG